MIEDIPARTGFLATSRRKSGRGDIVVVLSCCLCCISRVIIQREGENGGNPV